jgi:non-ribosomal peptide synthetase component F
MNSLLTDLLESSTAKSPDETAAISDNRSITYAGLEDITSRLAALLKERGVSKGDRVGIYLDKSIESVIGVLGVLKAGGVYVPVDPNAPPSRVA